MIAIASTINELIARGKAQNEYNNSGIRSDAQWVDFFNEALRDLVDDLRIEKTGQISFDPAQREYDLPPDFYSLVLLNDEHGCRVFKRRYYDQRIPSGYWIFNRGDKHVIDLYQYMAPMTFTFVYQAYPEPLVLANLNTQRPQVPSVGEKALIYYAIAKALRNNNEVGQAQDVERLYELERAKIRNAVARGVN